MPVFMKLGLISKIHNVIESNLKVHKNIGNLVFTPKADVQNIDWSKAKVFVPSDPTAVPWIKQALSELPKDVNFTTAFLGGNNKKYDKNSLETKLARLMAIFNGYKLNPFVKGIESEIISEMVKDVLHGPIELEKESSNSKANWEKAFAQGMLNDVQTIIIVYSNEGVTRHIGTLKATLTRHGLDPNKYNIIAWPYTATISSENLNLYQQSLGVDFPVPKGLIACDKDTFNKSAWGIYRTFMELLAINRWSKKGDVYLTAEQKQLLNNIFSVKTLAFALGKTVVTEMKKAPKKLANLLNKER